MKSRITSRFDRPVAGVQHDDLNAATNVFGPERPSDEYRKSQGEQANSPKDPSYESPFSDADTLGSFEQVRAAFHRPAPRLKTSASFIIRALEADKSTKPTLNRSQSFIVSSGRHEPPSPKQVVKTRSILKHGESMSMNADDVNTMACVRRLSLSKGSLSRQLSFADDQAKPLEIVHYVPDTHYQTKSSFCCSIQ